MEIKQVSPATSLIGFGDIRKEPIDDWQKFLREGNQFLATASKAHSGGRKAFTPEILYNLVAMAIEKLIMALLMESGNLPYNHTMHDLAESMEEFLPGTLAGLGEELKALDAFQEICDPYNFTIIPPTMEEVDRMLELAGKIQTITITAN
jgi:hypothetical protein